MSVTETLTRGTSDGCHRCGEPLGTFRFCLNCGASVVAPDEAAAVAAAQPGEAAAPSRLRRVVRRIAKWRTPLVVVPLLAGLGAVAGVGAQMLTEQIPDPVPVTEVTCWDGDLVGSADGCSQPEGEAGLRWVFPTFHPNQDSCVDVLLTHPEYLRPAMYECDLEASGETVRVTYMQVAGVEPGRVYFEKEYAGSRREQVRSAGGAPYRYVWRQHTEDGFELASMYIDYPYAISIVAATGIDRDRALREIEFRHPDLISVAQD